jgi:hypothetical protein
MTKAVPQPPVTTNEISFELDRFELEDDDRLTLRGRWFGVRGRRFMRPSLTFSVDGERLRALADLEHKPWPAEDGAGWEATFQWTRGSELAETELSVAPDITIELPSPGRARRPRRIPAQPRRETMSTSFGEATESVVQASDTVAEPPPVAVDEELDALRAEVERLQGELASRHGELAELASKLTEATQELDATTITLASAQADFENVRDELEAAKRELGVAQRELEARDRRLEATKADLATAVSDRDAAITSAAEAAAERDAAGKRLTALTREVEQARTAQEPARSELERSERERTDAAVSHGAALVMRRAARAETHQRHAGWIARALALIVLLGVLFAALVVLHAI